MVNLGDKVKDPITGIEGIAYARTTYLQGCDRIEIQQPAFKDKDGETKVPNMWSVDEPQLVVVKKNVFKKAESAKTGGPSKFVERTR